MTDETALLFMAYGTPRSIEEVAPYFTHIRGGRRPSDEELRSLEARYRVVGGRTPLVEITNEQAKGAERLLREGGFRVRAYVGMKHWHPFIRETLDTIVAAGHKHIVGIPLAPFYSAVSAEAYRSALNEAAAGKDLRVTFVKEWHDNPELFRTWRTILGETFASQPLGPAGHLVFTAHSLPKARLPPGDPYEAQLRGLAKRLAESVRIDAWSFAFQSVGLVGGDWLGPEVKDAVAGLAADGVKDLVVAPLGFVADNLETLYDLDREVTEFGKARGMRVRRTPAPNARPEFLVALADVSKPHL